MSDETQDDREAGADQSTVTPAVAVASLSAAFRDDADFAWGWHSNLAMAAYDAGVPSEIANEAARIFMKRAFDVDTRRPGS